jgi:hypothetical protein
MPAPLVASEPNIDLDRLDTGSPKAAVTPGRDQFVEPAHVVNPAVFRRPPIGYPIPPRTALIPEYNCFLFVTSTDAHQLFCFSNRFAY